MCLSSSRVDQTPAPSPARNAAPRAVVSWISGRSTGMPSWSAWTCMSRSLALPPPSAFSTVTSSDMVATMSRTS